MYGCEVDFVASENCKICYVYAKDFKVCQATVPFNSLSSVLTTERRTMKTIWICWPYPASVFISVSKKMFVQSQPFMLAVLMI
jgi:hypothetical protein